MLSLWDYLIFYISSSGKCIRYVNWFYVYFHTICIYTWYSYECLYHINHVYNVYSTNIFAWFHKFNNRSLPNLKFGLGKGGRRTRCPPLLKMLKSTHHILKTECLRLHPIWSSFPFRLISKVQFFRIASPLKRYETLHRLFLLRTMLLKIY